MVMLWIANP